MADITARLLWYRLGESSRSLLYIWDGIQFVADAGGTALNWIFCCWILFGFLTMLFVAFHQHRLERFSSVDNRQVPRRAPKPQLCPKCSSSANNSSPSSSIESNRIDHAISHNFVTKPPQPAEPKEPVNIQVDTWLDDLLCWGKNNCLWTRSVVNGMLNNMTEESKNNGVCST